MQTTRRGALGAVLGGAALLEAADAGAQSTHAYAVPFTTVIAMTSRINGIHYQLYVRHPVGYDHGGDRYPVIVTLDADYSFSICANHLEHLAARLNQGPEAILVSIAIAGVYPDLDRYHLERTRDYTPVYSPDSVDGNSRFQYVSGGGPAFQRVIAEEVLPLIDARYRTDPNDRTLVGHSYGGLFVCWMLQSRPELFSRYLAVSASLWYKDKWISAREAELRSTRLPRRTRIYLAAGALENPNMAGDMEEFAGQLSGRGDPNLVVDHRTFVDETHASIFPAAFSTGIRHLFRGMD